MKIFTVPVTFTDAELVALRQFRDEFPKPRCRKIGCWDWREALMVAWLNDWPEQRGVLRVLRNRVDNLADTIAAFVALEKTP